MLLKSPQWVNGPSFGTNFHSFQSHWAPTPLRQHWHLRCPEPIQPNRGMCWPWSWQGMKCSITFIAWAFYGFQPNFSQFTCHVLPWIYEELCSNIQYVIMCSILGSWKMIWCFSRAVPFSRSAVQRNVLHAKLDSSVAFDTLVYEPLGGRTQGRRNECIKSGINLKSLEQIERAAPFKLCQ